jgi:hypothetical protein
MILENNDDDMIYVARKVFKTKCFKADQIKNLAYLFLTDQGKYKFLDAAFPYVYDTGEFKKLGTRLLKDEYFLNRFNAMIGQ